jgi:hypothetical protein
MEVPYREALSRVCFDKLGNGTTMDQLVGGQGALETAYVEVAIGFDNSHPTEACRRLVVAALANIEK